MHRLVNFLDLESSTHHRYKVANLARLRLDAQVKQFYRDSVVVRAQLAQIGYVWRHVRCLQGLVIRDRLLLKYAFHLHA